MLRIKLPGGLLHAGAAPRHRRDLEPASAAATASCRPGRTSSCTGSSSAALPEVFDAPGRRRAHHRRRLRRHRAQHHRLPRRRDRRTTSSSTRRRSSTRPPSSSTATPTTPNLPRKHKITIAACRDRCNAPEINCISLVGVVHDGVEGFAVLRRRRALLGAADRARPRRLRPQGRGDRGAARAPRRLARGPALPRLARQVADEVHGRRLRPRGHARRGRAAARPRARGLRARRRPSGFSDHIGVHAQSRPGLFVRRRARPPGLDLGRPDDRGRRPGRARRRRRPRDAPAELRRSPACPRSGSTTSSPRSRRSASRSTLNRVRAASIACTGEPHCNFSVTETKTRLGLA